MRLIVQLLVLISVKFSCCFNDFPSLMIANATMAVVIERPFFERTIVSKRNTLNAYEKKIQAFSKAISGAVKALTDDTTVGIEINVFQDLSVNLARDYTVLLSVASCDETWTLFRRARKEKLVHLAITDRDCPRLPIDQGISVPIIETGQELPQLFLDMRMAHILDWRRINLLHDGIFERDTIGRTLRALTGEVPNKPALGLKSESLFSTHSADSETATKRLIVKALSKFPSRRRSDDRYLVIVAHDIVSPVIEAARSLGMLHPESQWLFILPDIAGVSWNVTDFGKLLGEGENVAFIYNDTKADEDCQAGPECYAKEMVGALASAVINALRQEIELYERVTEEEFDAVRMTKAERSRDMVAYIRNELYKVPTMQSDSENLNKCGECMKWKILTGLTWGNSFSRKKENDVHQLLDVGWWSPGPGTIVKENLFPHSTHGFRGKALPIVTYHNPPWQFVTKSKKNGKREWGGLVFDIVDQLSRKLNFTYKLLEIGDEHRGKENSKGVTASGNQSDGSSEGKDFVRSSTLSGAKLPDAVRELVRGGRVFMAACASTVTEELKSTINFTLPISIQTYGLLASRPKQLSRAMLFASPYTPESWACLAGGILLIGPILYLVHTYSPRPQIHETLGLGSPSLCLWYIYGALLQQGGMHIPQNDGARLIIGTWWLVVMVLVATYSGSLVAFLTFPRMADSISSVEDLLKRKGELTWSLPAKSFIEAYLSNAVSDGIYDGLLGDEAHLAERHDSRNYESILKRVKEGKHVLVDWTTALKRLMRIDNPLIDDGGCHFSIGTETFVEEPIALLLPSDSPYLELINSQLNKMHEAGLIGKWTTDRLPMRDECWEGSGGNREANNHKVDVWDIQGIFFVLFFGYLVALTVLTWEFYLHYRKLSKERKLIRPFLS